MDKACVVLSWVCLEIGSPFLMALSTTRPLGKQAWRRVLSKEIPEAQERREARAPSDWQASEKAKGGGGGCCSLLQEEAAPQFRCGRGMRGNPECAPHLWDPKGQTGDNTGLLRPCMVFQNVGLSSIQTGSLFFGDTHTGPYCWTCLWWSALGHTDFRGRQATSIVPRALSPNPNLCWRLMPAIVTEGLGGSVNV